MKIEKIVKVPTGEIYVAEGQKGSLEFLTVGDYGKDANIKADFLGITRELNGVPNGEPMPLTEEQREAIKREIVDVTQLPDCTPNDIKLLCFGRSLAILTIFGSDFFNNQKVE